MISTAQRYIDNVPRDLSTLRSHPRNVPLDALASYFPIQLADTFEQHGDLGGCKVADDIVAHGISLRQTAVRRCVKFRAPHASAARAPRGRRPVAGTSDRAGTAPRSIRWPDSEAP